MCRGDAKFVIRAADLLSPFQATIAHLHGEVSKNCWIIQINKELSFRLHFNWQLKRKCVTRVKSKKLQLVIKSYLKKFNQFWWREVIRAWRNLIWIKLATRHYSSGWSNQGTLTLIWTLKVRVPLSSPGCPTKNLLLFSSTSLLCLNEWAPLNVYTRLD